MQTVTVKYDECELEILIPDYFEEMPIYKIRKIYKLLRERHWQNEETLRNLNLFFQNWELELTNRVTRAANELQTAELAAEETRKQVACFGTMAAKVLKKEFNEKLRAANISRTAVKKAEKAYKNVEKLATEFKAINAMS